MKREQLLCLSGGGLLLLGALVFGITRNSPPAAIEGPKDGPGVAESREPGREHALRASRNALTPQTPRADGLRPGLAPNEDPEESPEFFASLVEEARPVLAKQMAESVTRAHRRIVERELIAMTNDGEITRTQADAIRHQQAERFAAMMAAEVDAATDDTEAFSDVWHDTLARADEWAAATRAAARKLTSPAR